MKCIILLLLCSFSLQAKESEIYTKFIWSGNVEKLEKKVNEALFVLHNSNKNIKEIKMSGAACGGLVLIVYENNNMEK
jgi:transcriptional regulator of aromatic amino acid metabolism